MTQRRILCLWFPNWPIQRLYHERSVRNRCPTVLYAADARQRYSVVACSREAADLGVYLGMPLVEVKSIVGQITIERYDPSADRAWLEKLAVWCERFSPLVGLEVADMPRSLLLDITGVAHLFGDEQTLADTLHQELTRQRYRVRIAIADTLGAAWGLAHFAESPVCIAPIGCQAALAPLPTVALRLPENIVATLRQLGITTIEQLWQLPRASLPARFGDALPERLEQLSGARAEVIAPYRPPPEFQATWSPESPIANREAVEYALTRLIEQLAVELVQHDRGAMQLECLLYRVGQEPVSLVIGLFVPTASVAHLMELIRLRLDALRLSTEVVKLAVAVIQSAPLVRRQYELFADPQRDNPQPLALLIDRLSSRLGRDAVVRSRWQAGAQPERTYRLVPLTGTSSNRARRSRSSGKSLAHGALPRPLRLLSPPLSIEIIRDTTSGAPTGFHHQRQRHAIVRHWGPERIETAWWRGHSVRRDYYRIETTNGSWLWIFLRLQDKQWFLHGTFD